MRKVGFVFVVFSVLSVLSFPFCTNAQEVDLNFLVSDNDLLDKDSMNIDEIKIFLSRGYLDKYTAKDIDGKKRSAAEIIYNAATNFRLSPKFLLTLLQREQSLVEDDSPSSQQLTWAMGYGVCDGCSKKDPALKKFRGFASQIYFSAKRIRESYLTDLQAKGFTETGMGPGIEKKIDGVSIIPANNATAVLYTYTPHIQGNENFATIWKKWFDPVYPTGVTLEDETNGALWLIQNSERRPIKSMAVFLSRFNPNMLVKVPISTIEKYKIGKPISFPNYSLLRSPKGTVYLIVNDLRRGFVSQAAFNAAGFIEDEIVDVSFEDLEVFAEGEPITITTIKPEGVLLQNKSNGGVYYVENGMKHQIYSKEILANRFAGKTIIPVDVNELNRYSLSDPIKFMDGTLVGKTGVSDVFLITNGTRMKVADEATFIGYGWEWKDVVWSDEKSLSTHPINGTLTTEMNGSFINATN